MWHKFMQIYGISRELNREKKVSSQDDVYYGAQGKIVSSMKIAFCISFHFRDVLNGLPANVILIHRVHLVRYFPLPKHTYRNNE